LPGAFETAAPDDDPAAEDFDDPDLLAGDFAAGDFACGDLAAGDFAAGDFAAPDPVAPSGAVFSPGAGATAGGTAGATGGGSASADGPGGSPAGGAPAEVEPVFPALFAPPASTAESWLEFHIATPTDAPPTTTTAASAMSSQRDRVRARRAAS
jgi:hypothetical protein